jgi:putative protease
MTSPAFHPPEILAPAGTEDAFDAALASGADAIYLGLSEGFNARARSSAFTKESLPELVRRAHRGCARLYVTLNTLVFESELVEVEELLRGIIESGVDALIIQDPATAFIARRLSKEIRLHASTQMTISSVEGGLFAATLGMDRVVLPRELSAKEIALFTMDSPLESEVFVHGALCMSWSGQCLTSEAFSERSANRGQCSQACRMPYDAIVDGEKRDFGDLRYLLSPQDLAAHEALPELLEAGVKSLKIEGRYKGPAYVATAVGSWKNWRDALVRGVTDDDRKRLASDVLRTQLTYSRGGSTGFLAGENHQTLVVATTPKHRGVPLGEVRDVQMHSVIVELWGDSDLASDLRPGMGIMFEPVGRAEKEHDPENIPGGPLFSVRKTKSGRLELTFGRPGPDLAKVRVGDAARLTGDPDITRDVERQLSQPLFGRLPLRLAVFGAVGEPLRLRGETQIAGRLVNAEVFGEYPLEVARSGVGLERTILAEKLGALGGTPYFLSELDSDGLAQGLHVAVSQLKNLRRSLVAELEGGLSKHQRRDVRMEACIPELRRELSEGIEGDAGPPELVALCRTEEQLEALILSGFGPGDEVELDWMEMVGLSRAVGRARSAGLRVTLATVRVQKPGEEAYDRRIDGLKPDGVLVRHWGALMHFSQSQCGPKSRPESPQVHGDFSLNVTNSLTAQHLLKLGLSTVTASHDLNRAQLLALLHSVPRGRVAVTLHHHISTFHNSHCVYSHLLSEGTDFRNCGRPCEKHRIALRDYTGHEHPVVVDVSCRNTVFNGAAQSAAPLVPELLKLGVRRFRVEFVWEKGEEVRRTLTAYKKLLAGEISPKEALGAASVHERYGITTPLRIRKKN